MEPNGLPTYGKKRIDRLVTVSWLYLWLPVWLFLATWFRPELGLPAMGLAIGAVGWLVWQTRSVAESARPWAWTAWGILIALSLAWAWLAGMGGWTSQHSDYDKHNLIFRDLIVYAWPVQYQNPARHDPFLCYYVAYYLPVAALVKALALSDSWIDWLSFGWGWTGILLVLTWVVRLSGRWGLAVAVLLLLLSGLEVPLRLAWAWLVEFGGDWPQFESAWRAKTLFRYTAYGPPRFFFLDKLWAHSLDSTPLMIQLVATPQHALGGWLATGLWLHGRREGWSISQWAVLLVPTLLWSPFVTVGLVGCIAVDAALGRGGLWLVWQQLNRSAWLVLAAIMWPLSLLAMYLAAHEPVAQAGFLPVHWQQPADAVLFLAYTGLQFGLPLWLLTGVARSYPGLTNWQRLCRQSAGLLVAQTLIHLGHLNDFQVRAIIPAQFVCMLALANGLMVSLVKERSRQYQWGGRVFLLWGGLVLLAPVRAVGYTLWAWHLNPRRTHIADSRTDISQLRYDDGVGMPVVDYAAQYLGRRDYWYWTWASPKTAQRNGEKSVGVK